MKKVAEIDPVLADSILLDAYRDGKFSTPNKDLIKLIGYLSDQGYVEKQYSFDANGCISGATIIRTTTAGNERIKTFYEDYEALNTPTTRCREHVKQDSALDKSDEEKRVKAEESYDSMIRKISYGGLGIALSVFSLVFITDADTLRKMQVSISLWMLLLCTMALLAWIGNIIILLWLERRVVKLTTNRKLENTEGAQINDKFYNAKIQKTENLNILNGFLAVGGVLLFAIFAMTLLFKIHCANNNIPVIESRADSSRVPDNPMNEVLLEPGGSQEGHSLLHSKMPQQTFAFTTPEPRI